MREKYLKIRGGFKQGNIPIKFLEEYCIENHKDSSIVREVLDFLIQRPFVYDLQNTILSKMVNHFDYIYKLQILYNNKNEEIRWY
jgi:hypothetical protein